MFFGQALEPGEYVTLTVTDTGSGMDHQTIQRVFDPLFSTKFAGHGLGMSAVGGIMRVHNGAVSISSRVGTGTTIRLLFPASDAAIVTHKPQSTPLVSRQERGTILVVEDEPAIREVVVETLQGAGYDVLSAADGAIAQDLIRRNRKPITGAVIDMMMPNVDGAELHEHLLDVAPDVRVILTSGYNEKEATRRIVTSGRAAFRQEALSTRRAPRRTRRHARRRRAAQLASIRTKALWLAQAGSPRTVCGRGGLTVTTSFKVRSVVGSRQ